MCFHLYIGILHVNIEEKIIEIYNMFVKMDYEFGGLNQNKAKNQTMSNK